MEPFAKCQIDLDRSCTSLPLHFGLGIVYYFAAAAAYSDSVLYSGAPVWPVEILALERRLLEVLRCRL